MDIIRITDTFSISAQPSVPDLADMSGVSLLINARPDGEAPDQPGTRAEAASAATRGMDYAYIPVTASTITRADVRAFQRAKGNAKGPVLAHCQTGRRALLLYVMAEVLDGRMSIDQLTGLGAAHGFDLAPAKDWLGREHSARPIVEGFFEPRTSSVQYVAADPATGACAIIDPVLDYDEKSGATATHSADALLAHIARQGLRVEWILETHPHADHFSAARYLAQKTGAQTATGAHVTKVQTLWKSIYNWPDFPDDGRQWDRLFGTGDRFSLGTVPVRVLFSPGHTLASVTYVIGDAAFVHDTLFMPDSGTARADFPGGSAAQLWDSIAEILALPDATRLFTGHDYQPGGRNPRWESSVAAQKSGNAHIAGQDAASFVRLREARDKTLPMPKLILQALQVNINGGRLPDPEANGGRYLKIPLNALGGAVW